MSIRVACSSICTAFSPTAIGTRVIDSLSFNMLLRHFIINFGWNGCREPGQAMIPLEGDILDTISSGVGPRTRNPEDYVLRLHRGYVSAFLKREHAAKLTGAAVIVYTSAAYCADPQVAPEEAAALMDAGVTHVIIAVLGYAGPGKPPLTPHRFIENLAGGNKEALRWSADEIRHEAGHVAAYDREWAVVAD